MCGIVGAIGAKNILSKIVDGLQKLEYRGYDSAGVALLEDGIFKTVKQEGKIQNLVAEIKKSEIAEFLNDKSCENLMAIGHTRWATHGRPSQENSHPHASSKICVVHNGIIENYQELREKFSSKGAKFLSETDSEVVPHLIEENYLSSSDAKKSIQDALAQIKGSYALAIMFQDHPEFLAIAKKGSPLLIGVGENENYIASDYYALADYTNKIIYLNDGEFAFIYKNKIEIFDANGKEVSRQPKIMESLTDKASKGDFEHFMLKEIYEQPQVIANTIENYVDVLTKKIHLPNFSFDISKIKKITIIACGTSYYAGMAAKYLFEEIAEIEVEVDIASEFRYRKAVFRDDNLMVFISQSGETADTIAALKFAKENNQKILSIVNVANSSMADLSNSVIKTIAGIEIGVASTKAYSAQICVLALLAIQFGQVRGNQKAISYLDQIINVASKINEIFVSENFEEIKKIAHYLCDFKHVLFIGRGVSYVSALEGALKLREISYIDSQAIAAGELKHGTIALIDEKMPVIVVAPSNNLFEKIASNVEEIKARRGNVIALSDKNGLKNLGNLADKKITIPQSNGVIEESLLGIIPLQILSYYVSLFKGNDVDKPRNLAKSVTVE